MKIETIDGIDVISSFNNRGIMYSAYDLPEIIKREKLRFYNFDEVDEFRWFGGIRRLKKSAVRTAKIKNANAVYIYAPVYTETRILASVDYYR